MPFEGQRKTVIYINVGSLEGSRSSVNIGNWVSQSFYEFWDAVPKLLGKLSDFSSIPYGNC